MTPRRSAPPPIPCGHTGSHPASAEPGPIDAGVCDAFGYPLFCAVCGNALHNSGRGRPRTTCPGRCRRVWKTRQDFQREADAERARAPRCSACNRLLDMPHAPGCALAEVANAVA